MGKGINSNKYLNIFLAAIEAVYIAILEPLWNIMETSWKPHTTLLFLALIAAIYLGSSQTVQQ